MYVLGNTLIYAKALYCEGPLGGPTGIKHPDMHNQMCSMQKIKIKDITAILLDNIVLMKTTQVSNVLDWWDFIRLLGTNRTPINSTGIKP